MKEIYDKWSSSNGGSLVLDCVTVYAIALLKLGERDKALTEVQKIETELPKSFFSFLSLCDFYGRIRRFDRCIEILNSALDQFGEGFHDRIFSELGRIHCEMEQWENARDSFNLVSASSPTGFYPVERVRASFETGRLAECLEACRAFESEIGYDNTVWQILAIAYYTIGEPQMALPYAREFREKSSSLQSGFLLSKVLLRAGFLDQSRQLLETIHDENPNDCEVLSQLSVVCASIGFVQKAVDYARAAFLLDDSNERAINAMSSLLLLGGAEGYLCDDDKELIQRAIRKNPNIQEIHLGEEGDPDFEPILSIVRDRSEKVEEAIENYKQTKIPIEVFAKLTGSDAWAFWIHNVFHKDGRVYMACGTIEEQIREQNVAFSSEALVLDCSAIFSLALLKLFTEFHESFSRIIIPTHVFEYFNSKRLERDVLRRSDSNLSYQGGKYFYQESSKLATEWENQKFDLIFSFFEMPRVEIRGLTPELWERLQVQSPKDSLFGFYYTMFVSVGCGAALYSDQVITRQLFEGEFAGSAFSTQALLKLLLRNGVISRAEYDDRTLELLKANYEFVSVSAEAMEKGLAFKGEKAVEEVLLKYVSEFLVNDPTSEENVRVKGESVARIWMSGAIDRDLKIAVFKHVSKNEGFWKLDPVFLSAFLGGALRRFLFHPRFFYGFIWTIISVLGRKTEPGEFVASLAIRLPSSIANGAPHVCGSLERGWQVERKIFRELWTLLRSTD